MQNYFSLFSIDESFDIDLENLENKYFALQAKFHPDLSSDDKEKQERISQSILINNAYNSLKNPFERAAHILSLHGVETEAVKLPESILEKIMEMQETLEMLIVSNSPELENFKSSVSLQKERMILRLREAFSAKNYHFCAEILMEMRYLEKLYSLT
ncbi:MAG: Fe-S protein assembly co-chaperone HscB, partial [Pseudomonadota bacterium]